MALTSLVLDLELNLEVNVLSRESEDMLKIIQDAMNCHQLQKCQFTGASLTL